MYLWVPMHASVDVDVEAEQGRLLSVNAPANKQVPTPTFGVLSFWLLLTMKPVY